MVSVDCLRVQSVNALRCEVDNCIEIRALKLDYDPFEVSHYSLLDC